MKEQSRPFCIIKRVLSACAFAYALHNFSRCVAVLGRRGPSRIGPRACVVRVGERFGLAPVALAEHQHLGRDGALVHACRLGLQLSSIYRF